MDHSSMHHRVIDEAEGVVRDAADRLADQEAAVRNIISDILVKAGLKFDVSPNDIRVPFGSDDDPHPETIFVFGFDRFDEELAIVSMHVFRSNGTEMGRFGDVVAFANDWNATHRFPTAVAHRNNRTGEADLVGKEQMLVALDRSNVRSTAQLVHVFMQTSFDMYEAARSSGHVP